MFKYLDFFTCLLLPSFSSFAYGFALDLVAFCSLAGTPAQVVWVLHPFLTLCINKASGTTWKTHLFEILALPNLPSRHISAARALTTSSPPSKAQWPAEERSGDLEGSCLTCRDTRCLQQADLSHLAMKHCLYVDCTAACSKKQLSSQG